MVSKMFPPEEPPAAGGRRMSMKAATKTLGGQFKTQLQDLIATLNGESVAYTIIFVDKSFDNI